MNDQRVKRGAFVSAMVPMGKASFWRALGFWRGRRVVAPIRPDFVGMGDKRRSFLRFGRLGSRPMR